VKTIDIVQNVHQVYTSAMKSMSVSNARKYIGKLIDDVVENGEVIGIKRHNQIDALIVKFPKDYRPEFSDIANLNAYSTSFDFLKDEPDDYSRADIIHFYKK
jgi:hypothetical protein